MYSKTYLKMKIKMYKKRVLHMKALCICLNVQRTKQILHKYYRHIFQKELNIERLNKKSSAVRHVVFCTSQRSIHILLQSLETCIGCQQFSLFHNILILYERSNAVA